MPAEPEADGLEDEEDGEEEKPKKKKDLKTILMMAGSGLCVLLIVGGAVAFALGFLDPLFGIQREKTSAELELGTPVTHELPQIKADLKTGRCRAPFLRAIVVVQLGDHDLDKLTENQAAVIDAVTIHLRDQERQDLAGKAGANRLRFDLVNILNKVLAPARVHGVLFKEFILQ